MVELPDTYEDVHVEVTDSVAVITIDRPPRNALVPTTLVEVWDAVARCDDSDEVRCMVLTGAGDHFSAGADLSRDSLFDAVTGRVDRDQIRRLRDSSRTEHGYRYRNVLATRTPVIAAINGAAIGGGLGLAAQADIRVASETARLSFAFTRRGMVPEQGAAWLIPRLIGYSRALELLLTGREMRAQEAEAIGFVARVVERDALLPTALELAHDIAENCSPSAVSVSKELLWAAAHDMSFADVTHLEQNVLDWFAEHGDVAEGMRSFLERRPPEWRSGWMTDRPPGIPPLNDPAVDS
jgi:enoyl-CoA hydratase/carnithine racemase